MIEVWLGVAAVALLAVVYVAASAPRGKHRLRVGASAAAVFRDRRTEIEAEAKAQGIGEGDTRALTEELALDFLDETDASSAARHDVAAAAEDAPASGQPMPPFVPLVCGAVAVAGLAIGLYALWGEPNAPLLADAGQLVEDAAAGDDIALPTLESALAARAKRRPSDADSLFFLGHVRLHQSNYRGAAEAFAALHAATGANSQVDLAWARASYLADDGNMSAATRRIVERVLASVPEHPDMLELLAMDALRRGDFATGARHLARTLRQELSAARRQLLEQTLTLARTRLDPKRPLIEVEVQLDGATEPWLVVFARAVGGGMPLAAVRRPAHARQTVVLDDATRMSEALPLSAGGTVEVVARLSATGAATDASVEAVSAPVQASAQPLVRLTLKADEPPPRTRRIVADVSLAADIPPHVPVYVIARDPTQPGPPLAVRRLFVGDLPTRIELTDADAMLPGGQISELDLVELFARASLGGTPTAQSGDLESARATIRPDVGIVAQLRIDRAVP